MIERRPDATAEPAVVTRRAYDGEHDPLVAFARANPCPRIGAAEAPRFLDHLTTSPAGVVDLHVDGERAALAVVVDACDNRDDSADLVLLGLSGGALTAAVLTALVDHALAFVRAGPRRALDLSLDPALAPHRAVLEARGFRSAYATHRMTRTTATSPAPRTALPPGARFVPIDAERVDGYYEVVRGAFGEIPGANVPGRAAFCANALARADPARQQLLVVDGRVVGFATTRVDEGPPRHGEVYSLGRDSAARGRGLGEHLLAEALRLVAAADVDRIELEVAAVNTRALALYQRFGFTVIDTLETLRCPTVIDRAGEALGATA